MGDFENSNETEEQRNAAEAASTGDPRDEPDHLPIPDNANEIVDVASRDLKDDIVDVEDWGFAVKIRSFTAAEQATIRQIGFQQTEGGININWALMEITQLQMGVKAPAFSEKQARALHMKSGPGFAKIIKRLDEISGFDKKGMEDVKETFQGSDEPGEV